MPCCVVGQLRQGNDRLLGGPPRSATIPPIFWSLSLPLYLSPPFFPSRKPRVNLGRYISVGKSTRARRRPLSSERCKKKNLRKIADVAEPWEPLLSHFQPHSISSAVLGSRHDVIYHGNRSGQPGSMARSISGAEGRSLCYFARGRLKHAPQRRERCWQDLCPS